MVNITPIKFAIGMGFGLAVIALLTSNFVGASDVPTSLLADMGEVSADTLTDVPADYEPADEHKVLGVILGAALTAATYIKKG